MTLYSFDPAELSVIAGPYILRGFAETMVEIDRINPTWELVVGADGEATRVKSNDRSATIVVTLQQSSPSNDDLSTLAIADELSNTGLFPILIKDNMGTTVASATTCWIDKIPTAAYGKTVNDRAWTLRTDNLAIFLGGNTVSTT